MQNPKSKLAGPDRTARKKRHATPSRAQAELVSRDERTTRSILVAACANVAIGLCKAAGAAITGSGALLAEALHSLADTANSALLLWGRREARTPPTMDHPLGHGRATYVWSFVVSLMLFSGGGIVSIYQGIHRLQNGSTLESPWVAIGVLLFALAADGTSQIVTIRSINNRKGTQTLWRWLRDTRHSELIVVFAEDVAALIGIVIALAAVIATMATGNVVYDAAGSIAIGVLLIAVAIMVSIEIKSLLIGESASPKVRKEIVAFLEARPEIAALTHLISSQHGEELMLGIKAQMRAGLSAQAMINAINECETDLRARFPQVKWIFFEPVAKETEGKPPD